jgi:DNA-binding NarL/FixJ family response regulator
MSEAPMKVTRMATDGARILLVDDHALFRESLARFLDQEAGLKVVGGCATIEEAKAVLESQAVDLVLLDFDLGERNGEDFLRMSSGVGYTGRVLMVTAGLDQVRTAALVRRGISGVVRKHDPPAALVNAIREVLAGRVWFDQHSLKSMVEQPQEETVTARKLTDRERQVLAGVFEGLANKQIADQLQVSESSVKATLQQLFHKTGVRTRSQLVRIALERYHDQL